MESPIPRYEGWRRSRRPTPVSLLGGGRGVVLEGIYCLFISIYFVFLFLFLFLFFSSSYFFFFSSFSSSSLSSPQTFFVPIPTLS